MGRNVEVKCRIEEPDAIALIAKKMAGFKEEEIIVQNDTFFYVPRGMLKLRETQGGDHVHLIYYDRPDGKEPKLSDYSISKADNNLLHVLTSALKVKGNVRKIRHLIVIGQTRIHVDKVEGLGSFLELEVVLTEDQTEEDGKAIAQEFMDTFAISEEDLVECSYMDLLIESGETQ